MIFKNLNMPPAGDNTPAQIPFGIQLNLCKFSNPIVLASGLQKLQQVYSQYCSKYNVSILKILLKVGSNIFTSAMGFPLCLTKDTPVGSPSTLSWTRPVMYLLSSYINSTRPWANSQQLCAPTQFLSRKQSAWQTLIQRSPGPWQEKGHHPQYFSRKESTGGQNATVSHRDANPNTGPDSFCDPYLHSPPMGFPRYWCIFLYLPVTSNELCLEITFKLAQDAGPKVVAIM